MSTNPSIPEVLPPHVPAKRLIRKYDKRAKSKRSLAAIKGAQQSTKQLGRKPPYIKALSQRKTFKVLEAFDAIATLAQIYQEAWDKKQLSLCVQMRDSAEDRLFGKPFTAINPAASEVPHTLHQDNRLQIAIQQMLPSKGSKPASLQGQTSVELTQAASLAAIPVRKS